MNELIIILVIFIAFLLGRELICWYFKLTEITTILKRIDESLNRNEEMRKNILNP